MFHPFFQKYLNLKILTVLYDAFAYCDVSDTYKIPSIACRDIFGTKTKIYQISYRKLLKKLFIPNYIVSKIIKTSKYILNSDSFFSVKLV